MTLTLISGGLLIVSLTQVQFHRRKHGRNRDTDRIFVLGCIALACITFVLLLDIRAA
jgi:hypothetical protein